MYLAHCPQSLLSKSQLSEYSDGECEDYEAGSTGGAALRCLGLLSWLRGSPDEMEGVPPVASEEFPLEGLEVLPVLLVLFLSPEGARAPRLQAPVDREYWR